MNFWRFLFSFVSIRKLLINLDAMEEQHNRAAEDLRDTINGNGNGKRKFQPRKFQRVVREMNAELGLTK